MLWLSCIQAPWTALHLAQRREIYMCFFGMNWMIPIWPISNVRDTRGKIAILLESTLLSLLTLYSDEQG
jgi:hypothetical protein